MAALLFQGCCALIALIAAVMAWRLERKLGRFRAAQEQMQAAAAGLNQAVARAEAGIRELRDSGAQAAADLEGSIARARAMSDELRLLSPGDRAERRPHAPAPSHDTGIDFGRRAAPDPARTAPDALRPARADLIAALKRAR